MHVLVTGSAGFIGYHLTCRLLEQGHDVTGVDSLTTGSSANVESLRGRPRFDFIQADIREPIRPARPVQRVFNMACPASPVDFADKAVEIMQTCSVGVNNLLDLALRDHALFLQASTSECYGEPLVHPQPETYRGNVNSIGPRAPYDEGKRFAEALVSTFHRLHHLPTRIVRIFNTYGPRMRPDDGRALPTFITQALRGEPVTIHGDGSQTRSFCYVDDLVTAILRAADCDFAEPINIGNDTEITILQAAQTVVELAGSKSSIVFTDRPINDPDRRRPDLSRAREVLGWKPTTPYREGFGRTVEYFRSSSPPGP